MKKAIFALCLLAACAALCAAVWTGLAPRGEVPLMARKIAVAAPEAPTSPQEAEAQPSVRIANPSAPEIPCKESETVSANTSPEEITPTEDCTKISCNVTAEIEPAAVSSSDPYHTDVYPNNVYFEEYKYNENGKLVSKTTTYPCDFSSGNFIWIDGHAYADVPGFGLMEWGGPNRVTVCYDMYENGNKVGTMGGEDSAAVPVVTPRERVEYTLDETGEIPPPPTYSYKPVIPADCYPGVIAD